MIPLMAFWLMHIMPNGPIRTLRKSARDVVAAAFYDAFYDAPGPLCERPEYMYLNR